MPRGTFSYVLEKPNIVPRKGLEPSWVAPLAPKASASTNFATWAQYLFFLKNIFHEMKIR